MRYVVQPLMPNMVYTCQWKVRCGRGQLSKVARRREEGVVFAFVGSFLHLEALLFTPKPGLEEVRAAKVQLGFRLRLPLDRFGCYLERHKVRLSAAVSVVF